MIDKKAQLVFLVDMYAAEFGPHDYAIQVFSSPRGDYIIMLTHSTESPDACVHLLTDEGYVPYDLAQARAEAEARPEFVPVPDMMALLAREKVLLEDLASVRKQMGRG